MATKHRKDVDRVDIHIASRFKAHLLKKMFRDIIQPHEVGNSFVQLWEERDKTWIAALGGRIVDTQGTRAIDLQIFHWVTRQIKKELAVPERQVVHVLAKMCLLRYPQKSGGWKTEHTPPRVLLEHNRIFGAGTIKKRRPNTASAKLETIKERIVANMARGWTEAEAVMSERVGARMDDLQQQVAKETERKQGRFEEIKELILAKKRCRVELR